MRGTDRSSACSADPRTTWLVALALALGLTHCQALLFFTRDPVPAVDASTPLEASADAPLDVGDGGDEDASVVPVGYAAVVREDTPVLYWRLGERDGAVAADLSGNQHEGAYVGGVLLGQPGAIAADPDTAASFDGTAEQHVRVQGPLEFADRAPITIEAWVRPDRGSGEAFDTIAEIGGFILFIQNGLIKFIRADGISHDGMELPEIPSGQFSHIVGTYDGTKMLFYIDGLELKEATSERVTDMSQPLLVGRHFPGTLDEVALYNYPLGLERIRAHHDAGKRR